MVSNDAALRIKAAHLGVAPPSTAAAPRHERRRPDRSGWVTFESGSRTVDRLYADGAVGADEVDGIDAVGAENEFAVLRAGSQSALARRVGDELTLLSHTVPEAWGLRARSKEQRFALELLLDPAIEVVALDGRAGTGKTLLAIAAGLEQVVEHGGTSGSPSTARSCRSAGRRRLPARRARREARSVDGGDPRRRRRPHRPSARAATPAT